MGRPKNIEFVRLSFMLYLVFFLTLSCSSQSRLSDKKGFIEVLIVTGMDIEAHDWEHTTEAIVGELEKDKRMKVDVLTDIYILGQQDLKKYDVVYLNFNNYERPDPDVSAKENLRSYVAGGGGLVIAHFASGAFREWPEFIRLAGRVWDGVNTHDPKGEFEVEILPSNSPVTAGLKSYITDDELYICLEGELPIRILAEAKSKVTGKYHPMAFIYHYKKGRVFHTTLGHDAKAIRTEGTAELIRRGVAWAAGFSVDSIDR